MFGIVEVLEVTPSAFIKPVTIRHFGQPNYINVERGGDVGASNHSASLKHVGVAGMMKVTLERRATAGRPRSRKKKLAGSSFGGETARGHIVQGEDRGKRRSRKSDGTSKQFHNEFATQKTTIMSYYQWKGGDETPEP